MSDLIDRQAAIDAIQKEIDIYYSEAGGGIHTAEEAIDVIRYKVPSGEKTVQCADCLHSISDIYGTILCRRLKKFVRVDADGTCKHGKKARGKWIIQKDNRGYTYGKCSICGSWQYAGELKYCPYCGVKMEGNDE